MDRAGVGKRKAQPNIKTGAGSSAHTMDLQNETIEKWKKELCRLRLLYKKPNLIVLTLRSDYYYYPGTDWPRLPLKSFEPEGKKKRKTWLLNVVTSLLVYAFLSSSFLQ